VGGRSSPAAQFPVGSDDGVARESRAMTRPLRNAQIEELAESLRQTLAGCEAGDLVVSTSMVHRIEGAVAALESVLGQRSSLLSDLTVDSK
jgi:hypothetical protein